VGHCVGKKREAERERGDRMDQMREKKEKEGQKKVFFGGGKTIAETTVQLKLLFLSFSLQIYINGGNKKVVFK
jgi:hypothetical protein